MGFVIVLLLVATGGYLFWRSNTRRGAELVRAHIFLSAVLGGETVEDANYVASFDVVDGPTETIRGAIIRRDAQYGGKQHPMIIDAYKRGMTPNLPLWYRAVSGLIPVEGS